MQHYTKEELDLFRHDKMSVFSRISCAAHLKKCPGCAALMQELVDDDKLISDLRNSIQIYNELTLPSSDSTAQ